MCGIAGFAGFGTTADLHAMTDALAHRGPDGAGFWSGDEPPVFLDHRRLAIIDIEGGRQPMWDAAGRIGVIFNGEIYNHIEMRRELEGRGHRFATDHSDTEVLIHGYREWGEGLLPRLNGMLAFALYDRDRARLFLARDRFGEKPLYYWRRPGRLAFASELSALARHSQIEAAIDPRMLQKFLAWGFLPAPNALYRDCAKLPGGSALTYDLRSDRVQVKRYWRFKLEPDDSLNDADVPRLAEELRALLKQAVNRRLISDVPLGLFLSGGIDSGAVLAAAARIRPAEQLSTFTIGFQEPSFDESEFARELAIGIGTRHYEQILSLSDARSLLPDVLGRLDEPLADASILPTYLLSRFTRQSITVALSGDGGDELFAGYDPFKALGPAQLYQRLVPCALHKGLRSLAELLPKSRRNMSFDFKLRRALSGLGHLPAYWNPVWLAPADPAMIAEIFYAPVCAAELYQEAVELWTASTGDVVDRTLEFYTNFYLPDDILAKVDRATMMVSLESRAVFLDPELAEFCRRLPNRFKFRHGERKWLLRRALADQLPKSVLERRKKGFGIPLASWLREWPEPRGDPAWEACGLSLASMHGAWSQHAGRKRDHRLLLFAWLALHHHRQAARAKVTEPEANG